jgi:hypothetical protein
MAQFVSTFDSYDSNRLKEQYSDAIYNLDKTQTPLLSMLDRRTEDVKDPTWLTDTLAAPGDNAQIEADEYSYELREEPIRVKNYMQILRKAWRISKSQEALSKIGPQSDLGEYRRKFGIELKRDIELMLLKNQGSAVGNSNTPRRSAGLLAWLVTNVNRGTGGANGGYNTATGLVTAATNGTKRAFTKAILDDIIAKTRGGTTASNATILMVSSYNKRVFSSFMSDAGVVPLRTNVTASDQATLVAAADEFISDFGKVTVMYNYLMSLDPDSNLVRNAILLDTNMMDLAVLKGRDIQETTPAITGDAIPKVIITECCLYLKNEKAMGVAADLFGTSATV